jgi:molybdate transport system ATP-binding protein
MENIAVRVRDRLILQDTCWDIRKGEQWVVVGPNGAGKSSLVRALAGEIPIVRGRVIRHYQTEIPGVDSTGSGGSGNPARGGVGYVSFELHRQVIAREDERDEARFFSRNIEDLTTVRQLIDPEGGADIGPAAEEMDIGHLLDRGIRFLSTGEMRKALIARAMLKSPRILILDEPFDGLDGPSREKLAQSVSRLMNSPMQVILAAHRISEILPEISHVLCLKDCRVIARGTRGAALTGIQETGKAKTSFSLSLPKTSEKIKTNRPTACPLIQMNNVTIQYGESTIIQNLNWTVHPGENWVILGPNGAGKTTLLSLISGDHPQAYANDIRLFGRPRGSGESIWEIKQHIGLVSSEFQVRYRRPLTAFEVTLSGFFDSVGLYRMADSSQRKTAHEWLERLGASDKTGRIFNHLSYGEQRMILLARALVKSPDLLILDEPCQGLDSSNRAMILNLIDAVCQETAAQILYVTHHPDESPSCVTHKLEFIRTPDRGYGIKTTPFKKNQEV